MSTYTKLYLYIIHMTNLCQHVHKKSYIIIITDVKIIILDIYNLTVVSTNVDINITDNSTKISQVIEVFKNE